MHTTSRAQGITHQNFGRLGLEGTRLPVDAVALSEVSA